MIEQITITNRNIMKRIVWSTRYAISAILREIINPAKMILKSIEI